MIQVHRQGDLLGVVRALHASGRLAGRLHRRQAERDQNADDRDHDQELNEGKTCGFLIYDFRFLIAGATSNAFVKYPPRKVLPKTEVGIRTAIALLWLEPVGMVIHYTASDGFLRWGLLRERG